ncbi:unnamed protein product [Chironomus riparius]|uniref:TIL domain-containing protein n=1 Tax=Chironomus riparius TaxID=315576 RepID=A0A9N9S9D2_9DIPT|nr:unnamed protein product [Chironomus riparius]
MKLLFFFLFVSLSVVLVSSECGPNEDVFDCQSSSRNDCGCSMIAKADCVTGCMCKNGYCRKSYNEPCEKRSCQHPYYS